MQRNRFLHLFYDVLKAQFFQLRRQTARPDGQRAILPDDVGKPETITETDKLKIGSQIHQ